MKKAHEQLHQAWQRLAWQWRVTEIQWQDLLRYRFEREYMHMYQPTVFSTLNEMQKLDRLIEQTRREIDNL